MGDISIVIVAYNRPRLTAMVCEKLRGQRGVDVEIIVCDDGSHPPSFPVGLVDRYIWRKDDGFHKVWCLNEGIRQASSDKIGFLDDDCIPLSDKWAGCHLDVLNGHDVSRGPFDLVKLDDNFRLIGKNPNRFGVQGTFFSIVNIAAWKSKLLGIGGFDPAFDGHYGHADLDFGLRVKSGNLTVGHTSDEALVFHVGDPFKADAEGRRDPAVLERNTRVIEKKWSRSLSQLKREIIT